MTKKALVALIVASFTLSGCGMFGEDGMFRNRGKDYLLSEEMPPLVVPEGLDEEAVGQLYPIPAIDNTAVLDVEETVPRPQPLSENSLEEVVKIQNLGDERWILSNRSPSEIWPRVRNLLNRSGIQVARAEAGEGILETVWLEFRGDAEYYHRYRFYIQPGVQVNSTEIKVLHDHMNKASDPHTEWPAASVDDKREMDMVTILAESMAGDDSSGTVSLLAQSIGGEEKVEVITPNIADPYLLMKLDYDRAWASVAYSAQRGGFTTIDQDQSAGLLFVNYTPVEQDEPGFFGRLFSWGDDEVLKVNYVITLTRMDDGIQVRIVDEDRKGLDWSDAIRLLKNVRANLS